MINSQTPSSRKIVMSAKYTSKKYLNRRKQFNSTHLYVIKPTHSSVPKSSLLNVILIVQTYAFKSILT